MARTRSILWALGLFLVLSPLSRPALADPVLVATKTPLGGGLVEYAVSVDFADGLSRSGFIEISFAGNFSSSTLALANWPDLQTSNEQSTVVELQGGTGGASQVDVVAVGDLVVPVGENVSYSAVVSRNGQNFVLVPEPGAGVVALAALVAIGALRGRPRRGRRRTAA